MSQKTDNLIKLALVFFVSLLSFSIGTYVGKKYSDNQHKLALLEPQKPDATTASAHEFESEAEHGKTENTEATAEGHEALEPEALVGQLKNENPGALTDAEVAKLAEEFASDESTTEKDLALGTTHSNEKVVTEIPNTTKLPLSKMIKPVVKVVAPAPTEKPVLATADPVNEEAIKPSPRDQKSPDEREPASLPPVAKPQLAPINYTIQIGSYPTEAEATGLTKSLQSQGYKTSYIPANVNGQVWYRVNVGIFGTIKEAQNYKIDFLEKTKMGSAIIQRVQR